MDQTKYGLQYLNQSEPNLSNYRNLINLISLINVIND
jgi:hypothetical protein